MDLNRETIRKLQGLIVFTVIVVVAGVNYKSLLQVLGTLFNIAFPFILGAAIAFILNVPMRYIERHLPLKSGSKVKRPVSLGLALLGVAGILFLVLFVVTPELVRTFGSLQKSVPVFLMGLQEEAERLLADNTHALEYINWVEIDWQQMLESAISFLKNGAGSFLSSTLSAALSIMTGMAAFFIGLVFAIYILLQKETLSRQTVKLMRAFLPAGAVETALKIGALSERTFSNFLTGQCLEAVILGAMFYAVLNLLGLPYGLLIGVLIAFTALIPMFGAFIGCAVGVFLMLMVSSRDAVLFVVVFFVLQQIEGNLIYPHVVGNSVGLPSIWVLVAVTVGGSMMGVVGMLIFIPICSVLYALLRELVNKRLSQGNS